MEDDEIDRMISEESLRKIPNMDGYYISPIGKVYSTKSSKMRELASIISNNGYKVVKLSINGKAKPYSVHRLIAITFIPRPEDHSNFNIVRHLNDIKTDNRIENLAWGSVADNAADAKNNKKYLYMEENPASKLCKEEIKYLVDMATLGFSQRSIAKILGVSKSTVNYWLEKPM